MLTNEKREALQSMATQLRRDVIEMTYKAQSGHPGGSCSLADIMAYLYFNRMRYDVNEPKALKRDRLVLSKGHAAPIWYAALAEAGFFPREEMLHLREIGHLLQGHPCVHIPGVDATTGSLGFGLSIAVGMAAAAKMDGLDVKVHAIVGDGEQGGGNGRTQPEAGQPDGDPGQKQVSERRPYGGHHASGAAGGQVAGL